MNIRLFRDPGPEGGGQGALTDLLTGKTNGIADITKVDPPAPPAPPAPVLDPNNPPAPPPAPPPVVEGQNPDGSTAEGYTKNPDGTFTKAPEPPKDDDDTALADDDPAKFYEEVAKISGMPIAVEYPAGMDPLSPPGVAHRDFIVRDLAIQEFDHYLEKKDPRSYAYMLHREAGGSDEEFMGGSTGYSLPELSTLDESADAQAAIYKHDLLSKGLDEDVVAAIVDKAIKDNKLKALATASYNSIKKGQDDMLKSMQDREKQRTQEVNNAVVEMKNIITETIKSNLKFQIPEASQPEFEKYVLENMQYDDSTKSFMLVQPVKKETLTNILNAMFFQFKGADLKNLVEKQAATKAAQRLRLTTTKQVAGPGEGGSGGSANNNGLTLGQMFVN